MATVLKSIDKDLVSQDAASITRHLEL